MNLDTIFSQPDRKYRYTLWREFGTEFLFDGGNHMKDGFVQFIALNPSTADDVQDDNTVRRCITFSKAWGFGAYCMTNLYAWRETDSSKLFDVPDPVGPDNDRHLLAIAKEAGLVVAAWGTKARADREQWAKANIPNLHYLRLTKDLHPQHPLYLPGHLKPQPWNHLDQPAVNGV